MIELITRQLQDTSSAFQDWSRLSLKNRWYLLSSLRDQIYNKREELRAILIEEARQTEQFVDTAIYAGLSLFSRKLYVAAKRIIHSKEFVYKGLFRNAYNPFLRLPRLHRKTENLKTI